MRYGRFSGARQFKFNSRLYGKLKAKYAEARHTAMSGSRNVMAGRRWVFSLELEKSMAIGKGDPVSEGWLLGRHSSQQIRKLKAKIRYKENQLLKKCQVDSIKEHEAEIRRLLKQTAEDERRASIEMKKRELEIHTAKYKAMHEEFLENGFQGVVRKFNYAKTRNNLLMLFKKHVPEYVPTACNRWKNARQ